MFRRTTLTAALCLAAMAAIHAQGIRHDSHENHAAAALFLRAGEIYPVTLWPAERTDVSEALVGLAGRHRDVADEALILAAELSPAGGSLFHRGVARLWWEPLGPDRVAPEEEFGYLDISRRYLENAGLATWDFGVDGYRGLSAELGFRLRGEWTGDYGLDSNLPVIGAEGNPVALDNHIMDLADLRYRSGPLLLSFGRSPARIGPGGGTSLYPTEAVPYLDRVAMTASAGPFTLDYLVTSIETAGAWNGYDLPITEFSGTNPGRPTMVAIKRISAGTGTLRVGLGEIVLYARESGEYTLADFAPLLDWHGADIIPNNMALVLDAAWTPMPGLELYAQVGADDINADIVGVSDGVVPTIGAGLAGAKLALPVASTLLEARVETGATHYLWGNFDGVVTGQGTTAWQSRALYRYRSDGGAILMPLTSPYGPGAVWFHGDVSASLPDLPVRLGLSLRSLWKYQDVDMISTEYISQEAYEAPPPFAYASAELSAGLDLGFLEFELVPGLVLTNAALYPVLSAALTLRWGGSAPILKGIPE